MAGPRIGRFTADGKPVDMPGHNTIFYMMGVLLLWVRQICKNGWHSTNRSSTAAMCMGVLVLWAGTGLLQGSSLMHRGPATLLGRPYALDQQKAAVHSAGIECIGTLHFKQVHLADWPLLQCWVQFWMLTSHAWVQSII